MIKTASLEPSQRLVALGVVLETYFSHVLNNPDIGIDPIMVTRCCGGLNAIPAPTADELGEVLPNDTHRGIQCVAMSFEDGRYACSVVQNFVGPSDESFPIKIGYTMAEAMCLMLIWLLEQGLLTKEEVMKGAGRCID